MKRRSLLQGGLAAVAGVSVPTPRSGGSLVWVVSQPPDHLVPALSPSNAIFQAGAKIHETMVTMSFDGTYRPVLATAWEASPDGRTFTFHLRSGVKWHDGTDFTSEDVAFSMQEMWKPRNPFARGVFGFVTSAETPDPLTVIFRASQPVPFDPLMMLLSSYGSVAPKHIYAGTDMLKNPAINHPIGTGPFRFKEWKKGEYVELVRNPDYWDPGKPYLDSIVIRQVLDPQSRGAMLQSGEAQFAATSMVGYDDLTRFAKMKTLRLDRLGNTGIQGTTILETNLRNPYLKDVRVRRAIAHAIDRQFIVDNIFDGYAKISWGPLPSVSPLRNPNVPTCPFDPAQAEKLLDEAGFRRGADGTRFKLFLDPSPIYAEWGQAADYIKQVLGDVGIAIEIRNFEEVTRIKRVYQDYDFDLTVYNLPLVLDPQISIVPYFWTKTIARGRTNTNAYDYHSDTMDKVIEALGVETDLARRKSLVFEMQRIAAEDLPLIFLVEPASINTISNRVHNAPTNQIFTMTNWSDVWMDA
jgi:peptide/nickel transport system substrate-binding protein